MSWFDKIFGTSWDSGSEQYIGSGEPFTDDYVVRDNKTGRIVGQGNTAKEVKGVQRSHKEGTWVERNQIKGRIK